MTTTHAYVCVISAAAITVNADAVHIDNIMYMNNSGQNHGAKSRKIESGAQTTRSEKKERRNKQLTEVSNRECKKD